MTRTIFLDLDGTLINADKRDFQIYKDILESEGLVPLDPQFYRGLRREQTDIKWLLRQSNASDSFIERFINDRALMEENMNYLRHDTLFDDVIETLVELRRRKHTLFVLTKRGINAPTFDQCERLGLNPIVDAIFITGHESKTERIKRHMKSSEDLMVGDTENDVLPAQEAGVISVAVTTGIRTSRLLADMAPNFIIDSLSELLHIVP